MGAFPATAFRSRTSGAPWNQPWLWPSGYRTFTWDALQRTVGSQASTTAGRPERAAATFTTLSDGRILSAGGWDTGVAYDDPAYPQGVVYPTSAQADLYDPATGLWSAAGSMTNGRVEHASVLLPTGQVMVVGGYKVNTDGTWVPVDTVELFDPDSRTWSVKERLDYGILSPQVAMQKDGGQFFSGLFVALNNGGSTIATEGSNPVIEGHLPAELRPCGNPQEWLQKLKRIQYERPELIGANSVGGLFWLPGAIFGGIGGTSITITRLTINQGVTRYLKPFGPNIAVLPTDADPNSPNGEFSTIPALAWKPEVPLIAQRKARIKGTVAFTSRVKNTIHIELRFVDDSGSSLAPVVPVDVNAGSLIGTAEVKFQKDLEPAQIPTGAHLQVAVLKECGGLASDMVFQTIPKFQLPQGVIVWIYPVTILQSDGTPITFDFSAEAPALCSAVRQDLERYFPVAQGGGVIVLPRAWPAGFSAPTWDGRASADGTLLGNAKWKEFVDLFTESVWSAGLVPREVTTPPDFHVVLFPPQVGLTCPQLELGINGITRAIGEHFVLAHSAPFSNTQTQFFTVHELGHALGRPHAPWRAGDTNLLPLNPDPDWPSQPVDSSNAVFWTGALEYREAMLGVEGWDGIIDHSHDERQTVVNSTTWKFKTERDLMCHPDGSTTGIGLNQQKPDRYWVSDYTFRFLFRPAP